MTTRITDNYMSSLMVQQMHSALADMLGHQQKAASMRRINSFADDPRAVGSIHRYRSLISANEQYQTNISLARGLVESSDSALQSVSEVLAEVRELVIREASAHSNASSRSQAAADVDGLMDKLVNILNITVEGSYIFGGHRTGQPPFARTGDIVSYQGDDNAMIAQIGADSQMQVSLAGSELLGTSNAVMTGLTEMSPQLDLTTPLVDLNLGGGWSNGSIRIIDGANTTHTIDLSVAATVGDVINAINVQSGGVITAAVSPDGASLQLSGPGPLTVEETSDTSTTAQTLGLTGSSDSGLFVGRDIRVAPQMTTALADIPAMSGNLPLDGITITLNQVETFVDFSAAVTIDDLRTAVQAAVPGMDLQIEGGAISIINGTSTAFVVGNNSGTDTANVLGVAGTGSAARLFGMFEDLKTALQANDVSGIQSTLGEITGVQGTVHARLIRVGGWQNTLDWMQTLLYERGERLNSNLSQVQDADISKVATDLAKSEAAYQATLMVTSQMFEVNLMDYLR